jgi:hypothetical protein
MASADSDLVDGNLLEVVELGRAIENHAFLQLTVLNDAVFSTQ